MPSFHLPPDDGSMYCGGRVLCDWCRLPAEWLRPVGAQIPRMLVCDACYDDGEAETSTEPVPAVQVVDELPGCDHWPTLGVYCAAAYLAWIESRPTFIPDGEPVLCAAHWRAVFDDAIRQFPSLICQPWKTPTMARRLGNVYIRVAERMVARIADRLESR